MRAADDAMLRNKLKNEFLSLLEWQENAEPLKKRRAIQEGIKRKCEYIRRTYGEAFYARLVTCANFMYLESRRGKPSDFLLIL